MPADSRVDGGGGARRLGLLGTSLEEQTNTAAATVPRGTADTAGEGA